MQDYVTRSRLEKLAVLAGCVIGYHAGRYRVRVARSGEAPGVTDFHALPCSSQRRTGREAAAYVAGVSEGWACPACASVHTNIRAEGGRHCFHCRLDYSGG